MRRWAVAGPVARSRWALAGLLGGWLLALALLSVGGWGAAAGAPQSLALRWAERWLYDLRLRALAPAPTDPQIVLIDIDERSLAEHGRWPWRRALLADLLDRAAGPGGARLLGLDLVLAEPDRSSGLAALDALDALVGQIRLDDAAHPAGRDSAGAHRLRSDGRVQQALAALRPQLDDDSRLITVLQRTPVVLGFHLSNEPGAARIGQLPAPLLPVAVWGEQADGLLRWAGHGGNLPALQAAAHLRAGHLNALIDSDSVVRRVPMLVAHDGGVQGTLALLMARALLASPDVAARPATSAAGPPAGSTAAEPASGAAVGQTTNAVVGQSAGTALGGVTLGIEPANGPLRALLLRGPRGRLRVPVDGQATALVPYSAPGSGFVRHSAADVLAGRLAPDALCGKVVLVGVSAPGLIDQRATPVDALMPGTLVHAHLLAGLLAGRMLAVPAQAALVEWLSLLLIGGALVLALPRLALWQGALLAAGLMAMLIASHVVLWQQAGWVLPLASGLLLPLALLGLHGLLSYRQATGARRQLAQLFGQYVPPELVQQMSRAPGRYSRRNHSAELSVLFAYVQGFSARAEHMAPAELGAMMNLLFSHLTDELRRHRGTLDKYSGDSVMAFWGAPLDDPDHARHAVAAALAMRQRLPLLHAELAVHGWPPLDINIGINTGTVVVGDMGSRHRRAYTVMGNAVNLAARLQALSSQHGLGLVVGDATRQALARSADAPLWGCAAAMRRCRCGMCWPGAPAKTARPTRWPAIGSRCGTPPMPAGWTRPRRCWTGWHATCGWRRCAAGSEPGCEVRPARWRWTSRCRRREVRVAPTHLAAMLRACQLLAGAAGVWGSGAVDFQRTGTGSAAAARRHPRHPRHPRLHRVRRLSDPRVKAGAASAGARLHCQAGHHRPGQPAGAVTQRQQLDPAAQRAITRLASAGGHLPRQVPSQSRRPAVSAARLAAESNIRPFAT